jgi:hypothetical protein
MLDTHSKEKTCRPESLQLVLFIHSFLRDFVKTLLEQFRLHFQMPIRAATSYCHKAGH